MFIIENVDSLINMDNVEVIDVIEHLSDPTEILASNLSGNTYTIYQNNNTDFVLQVYDYICRAIAYGFDGILIQNNADYVEVYKKGNPPKIETWNIEGGLKNEV